PHDPSERFSRSLWSHQPTLVSAEVQEFERPGIQDADLFHHLRDLGAVSPNVLHWRRPHRPRDGCWVSSEPSHGLGHHLLPELAELDYGLDSVRDRL
ncbi:MAG: hypothetical protein ABSH34_26830, partial [Verrucomicrobiota bacterium]